MESGDNKKNEKLRELEEERRTLNELMEQTKQIHKDVMKGSKKINTQMGFFSKEQRDKADIEFDSADEGPNTLRNKLTKTNFQSGGSDDNEKGKKMKNSKNKKKRPLSGKQIKENGIKDMLRKIKDKPGSELEHSPRSASSKDDGDGF
jgi:hypothetical protein